MKTISVGQLRQNPTQMLNDVERGETYIVTRYNQEIARVVPSSSEVKLIPPKKRGPSHTADLRPVPLPDGMTIDDLLEEMKGEW